MTFTNLGYKKGSAAQIIVLIFFISIKPAWSYITPDLEAENQLIYDIIEASEYSQKDIISIRPISFKKAIEIADKHALKQLMNFCPEPEPSLFKTLSFRLYNSQKYGFLEGMGMEFKDGWNGFLSLRGDISDNENLLAHYEIDNKYWKDNSRLELRRGYIKVNLGSLAFVGGKDSVNLGPGYWGQILSNNAEPFLMLRVQTENSLNLLGKWKFLILKGWLKEDRLDRDDPEIFILRGVYKPADFFEIGGTRGIFYGGEGRPGYSILEYPRLIIGDEENIPGSRYDNDSYGQLDFTLYLPSGIKPSWIRTLKIYYSKAGTDMKAWWQKEDRSFEFFDGWLPIGFDFLSSSKQIGLFFSTKKDIFRIEYTGIHPNFYIHHYYPVDGYSFKNLSLGYPIGRDIHNILFKHIHITNEALFYYMVGYYWPMKGIRNDKGYYLSLGYSRAFSKVIFEPFLSVRFIKNYDLNPLIHQFEGSSVDKTNYLFGITTKFYF
jgi:hypothetical protein